MPGLKPDPDGTRKERSAPRTTPRATNAQDQISESLIQIYTMLGMGIAGVGTVRNDPGTVATGNAIVERAEAITQEWLDLARQNSAVRNALVKLTQGAGIGGLVMLHFACITPFLASRSVIPQEAAMGALLMTRPGFDPASAMGAMFNANGNGDPDLN